jgi:hypothetical protein
VSRTPPTLDANGIPQLHAPEGGPTTPLVTSNDHEVEINPLLAGNKYFFTVDVRGDCHEKHFQVGLSGRYNRG